MASSIYQLMFTDLVQTLNGNFVQLDSQLSYKTAIKEKSEASIQSVAATAEGYRWIRFAEILDTDTHIYNFCAFPDTTTQSPYIEAEYVCLKGKVVLLLLECSFLGSEYSDLRVEAPSRFLPLLSEKYSRLLPVHRDRPVWSKGAVEPYAIWCSSQDEKAVLPAYQCTEEYLLWVTDIASQLQGRPALAIEAGARKRQLKVICSTFLENLPSRRFLEIYFGKGWTSEYIREFVYPMNRVLMDNSAFPAIS